MCRKPSILYKTQDKETQEETIKQVTPLLDMYTLTQVGQALEDIHHMLCMKTIVEKGRFI